MEPHKRWRREAQEKLEVEHVMIMDINKGDEKPCTKTASTRTEDLHVDMIHYTSLRGSHIVCIFDADMIKSMLCSNDAGTRNPRFIKNLASFFTTSFGKNGLVTLEGHEWQRHRRIISPSFQPKLIRESLNAVVPPLVQRFIDCWREGACELGNGSVREIHAATHFSMITLDIIGLAAFSHNFRAMDLLEDWAKIGQAQNNHAGSVDNTGNGDSDNNNDLDYIPPVSDKLMQAISTLLRPTVKRFILIVLGLDSFDRDTRNTRKIMNNAVDEVIQHAKLKIESNKNMSSKKDNYSDDGSTGTTSAPSNIKSKYAPKSLLETLLGVENGSDNEDITSKSQKPQTSNSSSRRQNHLNSTELRDEMKQFIVAGHETTSVWCHWCSFALSKYPDAQQKVYDDIVKHAPMEISSTTSHNSPITVEIANQMSYLDAFMKEVLRMYPPVGSMIRTNARDVTFNSSKNDEGNVTIPKGTSITIPVYLLHRHPKYWSKPDTFLPERWLAEDGSFPASNRHAYLPFSNGPRNCIGNYFATNEAKLIMAPLIREFVFDLAPSMKGVEFKLASFVTMKTKPALKICVRKRPRRK